MKESFVFSKANRQKIEQVYKKYPADRRQSAVMELLWIAQEQNQGHLSVPAIEAIADELHIPAIRVMELATFYSMYNTKPVGKFHVQVCRTLPCKLRNGDKILETAERLLGIKVGQTTEDGTFTLSSVECLGCCANAPVMQINQTNFEDLTPECMDALLYKVAHGDAQEGSQSNRQGSKPWMPLDVPVVKKSKPRKGKSDAPKST